MDHLPADIRVTGAMEGQGEVVLEVRCFSVDQVQEGAELTEQACVYYI